MAFGLMIPLCYLLGAIPFGLIVARLTKGVDVREYGSRKTGVTNVLRTAGAWAALAVLIADLGKGVLAVLLAKLIDNSPSLEVAAALSALVGHNWSIFIRFQGGRGTATGIGALLAISPLAGLITLVVGLPFIIISRYVSLGSIVGAVTAAVSAALLATLSPSLPLGVPTLPHLPYPAIGALIILFKHRDNIYRLLKGTERKLGQPAIEEKPSLDTS